MNLGDPELEYIDPTPNIHSLFIHFDKLFFSSKLASRAVVRWSKRMYSCAGICSYEGRGGLCDIALSEPLLKLRSRKNLVETLLHEMIHAFLFITGNDRDRDGHGPNFQSHMLRINKAAGVHITIYHDFHDEVKLYQTHVWRCNGPCQNMKPYFGIVRRPMNRVPGPSDYWWGSHKRKCNGTFIKIEEPKNFKKNKEIPKPMGDITKFINNNNKTNTNILTKANGGGTVIVTQKDLKSPSSKQSKITLFDGKGFTIGVSKDKNTSIDNVSETVRNVWAKKQEVITNPTDTVSVENIALKVKEVWAKKQIVLDSNKSRIHKKEVKTGINRNGKRTSLHTDTPTVKVKKIDDYFKTKATEILKDVYGKDFEVSIEDKPKNTFTPTIELVDCPICLQKVKGLDINTHIDECLNSKEINRISKTDEIKAEPSTSTAFITDFIDLSNIPTETTSNKKVDEPEKIKLSDIMTPQAPKFETSKITVTDLKDFIDKVNNTDAPFTQLQTCPCCQLTINKSMEEHMDECLAFFNNDDSIPDEGTSSSDMNVIVLDDDDVLDESMTLNATGTKFPCPVCLTMVEQDEMNVHLDSCLS